MVFKIMGERTEVGLGNILRKAKKSERSLGRGRESEKE